MKGCHILNCEMFFYRYSSSNSQFKMRHQFPHGSRASIYQGAVGDLPREMRSLFLWGVPYLSGYIVFLCSCHQCNLLYCPFYTKKRRYRPKSRGYFKSISLDINILAWSDPIRQRAKSRFDPFNSKMEIVVIIGILCRHTVKKHQVPYTAFMCYFLSGPTI